MAGFPFTLTILYMDLDGVPGLSEVAEPGGHKGQYIIILKNFFKRNISCLVILSIEIVLKHPLLQKNLSNLYNRL